VGRLHLLQQPVHSGRQAAPLVPVLEVQVLLE
jgi:hypothetical protein